MLVVMAAVSLGGGAEGHLSVPDCPGQAGRYLWPLRRAPAAGERRLASGKWTRVAWAAGPPARRRRETIRLAWMEMLVAGIRGWCVQVWEARRTTSLGRTHLVGLGAGLGLPNVIGGLRKSDPAAACGRRRWRLWFAGRSSGCCGSVPSEKRMSAGAVSHMVAT